MPGRYRYQTATAGLGFDCRNVSQIETDLRYGMYSKESVNTENRPPVFSFSH